MAKRPVIPVNTEHSGELETFMHQTLRPVLKQLNDKLLALARLNLKSGDLNFKKLQPYEKEEKIQALASGSQPFKNLVTGMVLGVLNEAEFDFYQKNMRDVSKRISLLAKERLVSQLHKL